MHLSADAVKRRAAEIGFDRCGIARPDDAPRLSALAGWIEAGHAGELAYLADSLDERLDPHRVLPGVRSVISLATVYNAPHPYSTTARAPGRAIVSRYAWGDDYHDVLRARLRRLVASLAAEAGPGFEAFSCTDSGPVQERVFAERAGLGWIGKNTCLINPTLGSWIFLAEILTNAELDPDRPGVDQCGTCTRCLDACPTGAIVRPYTLDATRCLAYLTIEVRGAVDEARRADVRHEIAGCDICQDVCPWNRRAATSDDPAWQPRAGLRDVSIVDLAERSDDAWRALIRGSALRRAGLRRIRRSLVYAAAALEPPDRDTALAALAAQPSATDPLVADALAWARTPVSGRQRSA